jgi:hypothetical protein
MLARLVIAVHRPVLNSYSQEAFIMLFNGPLRDIRELDAKE